MTRTPETTGDMQAFIEALRLVAPKRRLTYGESLAVARRQADRLRKLTQSDSPNINLAWLLNQRAVPVTLVPSHRLGEESGLTTNAVTGRLEVFLNQSEPHTRQRFSLLHEFKHVLDFPEADTLHAGLGCGDTEIQAAQIEMIANDFAGQVLMPRRLMAPAWFASHDLAAMATKFHVSREAMRTRLDKLGLTGDAAPRHRNYFRTTGLRPVFGETIAVTEPVRDAEQAA